MRQLQINAHVTWSFHQWNRNQTKPGLLLDFCCHLTTTGLAGPVVEEDPDTK